MIYIVRKEHFNAAHKLLNPNWSDKKNMEEFGVCSTRIGMGIIMRLK